MCVESYPALIPMAGVSPTSNGRPIGKSRDKAAANTVVALDILSNARLDHL